MCCYSNLVQGARAAAERDEGLAGDAETDRNTHRQKALEREQDNLLTHQSRRERERSDIHKERAAERQSIVPSGITEHCNRPESRQLGSAQVGLAADFLAVSLPTTAHGNTMILPQIDDARRSHSQ